MDRPLTLTYDQLTTDFDQHSVVATLACDDSGVLQPESAASLWNPRGYGNNVWARVALSVM